MKARLLALACAYGARVPPRDVPTSVTRGERNPMSQGLVRDWQLFALRGALAMAFGLGAAAWPGIPLPALVLAFGTYALLDAIAALAVAVRRRGREHVWLLWLEGLAGVGLAMAVLAWWQSAAELLVLGIALWAVVTGVLEVSVARRLRSELPGEAVLGVAGAVSVALGMATFVWPSSTASGLVLLLGSYGIVFGALLLSQGLRLRKALGQERDGGGGPGARHA